MVMYQIMQRNKLKEMHEKMHIVHEDCFDQFVAGVILWYQNQILYPAVAFNQKPSEPKPPNLFNLFEHPNLDTDTIVNLFVESDARNIMEGDEMPYHQAYDIAKENFHSDYFREYLYHDSAIVFDGYHMFYCYQDDAFDKPKFFNPYVKEVW